MLTLSFDMGSLFWGSSYQHITVLQNNAVRAVTSAKYFAHTQPLFRKRDLLNIGYLNIEDLYNQSILKYCSNCIMTMSIIISLLI